MSDSATERLVGRLGYLPLVFFAVLVIAWKTFLRDSLWLDELTTYWTVKDGLHELWQRVFEYQGKSPLYFLLEWGVIRIFGSSEWALRLISLCALLGTFTVVYRIARFFGDREYASIATLLFVSIDQVLRTLSAHSYGLALFFALLSVLMLLKWLVAGRALYGVAYAASTVVAVYSHSFFLGVVLLHAAIVFLRREQHLVSSRRLLTSVAAILAASGPGLWQMAEYGSRRGALEFTTVPHVSELLNTIFPGYLLIYIVFGALAGTVMVKGSSFRLYPFRFGLSPWILVVWLFAAPVLFFAVSHLTAHSIFVGRYFSWFAPALAFLGAWLIRSIIPFRARCIGVAVMAAFVVARESSRVWELENWRDVAAAVREIEKEKSVPVLFYSGLLEHEYLDWLSDPVRQGYLAAPAAYYDFGVRPIVIPSRIEEGAGAEFFNAKIEPQIAGEKEILLVALDRQFGDRRWAAEEYRKAFEKRGYSFEVDERFRVVKLVRVRSKG